MKKKKLTLVSLMCRDCIVEVFIELKANKEGDFFISQEKINELFLSQFGFTPRVNETVSITPKSKRF